MANPAIEGLDPYPGGGNVAADDFLVVHHRQLGRDFRAEKRRLGGNDLDPNDTRGADKRVRFQTSAQLLTAGGPSAGDCLEELNDETFCLGMLAWVEFPLLGHGVTFRLMYDGDPRNPANSGVRAYRTGHMVTGERLPAKWVRADEAAAGVATYTYLQSIAGAGGYLFKADEPIRDFAGTNAEYFFAAKRAGALLAPTSPNGDANWRRISPEQIPPPGPRVSPNNTRGADKRVRFLTEAQLTAAGGPSAGDSLEGIANDLLCLGQLAWVEFYGPGKYGVTLRLVYDGTDRVAAEAAGQTVSTVRAYRTGHCEPGEMLNAVWQEITQAEAGVPTYDQLQQSAGGSGYSFTVQELVRDFVGGLTEYFFAAKVAGPLPAPSNINGDANWRRVSPSEIPTAAPPFFLRNSLAAAVALDNDEAATSGLRYAVDFGGGKYVELVATEAKRFPYVGTLNGEEVKANIHNGYVELTGPEQVSYLNLLARFADTPPLADKLYGITDRAGGASVFCRFEDVSSWAPGGVTAGMLVAEAVRVVGQSGTYSYDLGADTTVLSSGAALWVSGQKIQQGQLVYNSLGDVFLVKLTTVNPTVEPTYPVTGPLSTRYKYMGPVPIVEVPGNSTTQVMSQSAVTTAISNLTNSIVPAIIANSVPGILASYGIAPLTQEIVDPQQSGAAGPFRAFRPVVGSSYFISAAAIAAESSFRLDIPTNLVAGQCISIRVSTTAAPLLLYLFGGYSIYTYVQPGELIVLSCVPPTHGTQESAAEAVRWQIAYRSGRKNPVATKTATVVSFIEPTEYTPLLNGTFTVDTTNAVVGNDVSVYLGPNCTAPTLSANFIQLGSRGYVANTWQMYTIKLGATGKYYYYVNEVPAWV